MKLILFTQLILPLVSLNLLDLNPQCKPNLIIGFCRAHWAYTLSDIITIQNCIIKNEMKPYSPQAIINNVAETDPQICLDFTNDKLITQGIDVLKNYGIGELKETPDTSYFTGKASSLYIKQDFEMKIKKVEEINDIELIKKSIILENMTPFIVVNFSEEILFDDLENQNMQFDKESGRFMTFSIVGFEEGADGIVWVMNNNLQDNWTPSGYTHIRSDNKNILKIFLIYLQL